MRKGNDDGIDYADAEPDGLGDLKAIKRINGMKAHAPKIRWGDDYLAWPVERRLDYAERMAAAMNHAADVLQQERQSLIDLAQRQEAQIVALQREAEGTTLRLHTELQREGEEKQSLYARIVELTAEVKALSRRKAGEG